MCFVPKLRDFQRPYMNVRVWFRSVQTVLWFTLIIACRRGLFPLSQLQQVPSPFPLVHVLTSGKASKVCELGQPVSRSHALFFSRVLLSVQSG